MYTRITLDYIADFLIWRTVQHCHSCPLARIATRLGFKTERERSRFQESSVNIPIITVTVVKRIALRLVPAMRLIAAALVAKRDVKKRRGGAGRRAREERIYQSQRISLSHYPRSILFVDVGLS